MTISSRTRIAGLGLAAVFAIGACTSGTGASDAPRTGPTSGATNADLSGEIRIDGSSTVYPVSEAIAEEFQIANPGVRVTVAFSGTGGGFKKFCNGETDANDASRPIKTTDTDTAKSEATLCREAGVEPIELRVAIDALSVVINPENDWATCMTTDELRLLWDQGSTVERWSDIRPEWPSEAIDLFGPGADSGTFDYFTEVINGTAQKSRSDFTQSEDDNTLVLGVAGDRYAIGYFGYAYFVENSEKLRDVEIDSGSGCVGASAENVNNGTYAPLSRPLFIYPSQSALERPEVAAFFRYYLDEVDAILGDIGYIPLPDDQLQASIDALEAALE